MKLHPLLLGSAMALSLAACNDTPAPSEPTPPPAVPAEVAAPPAGGETQAFYGDEAPVAVPAAPVDDHGHPHGEDAAHAHGDEAGHPHGDSTHSHDDEDEHDEEGHEHGDGSEPHDH